MTRKYLRISEVKRLCGVSSEFVERLEDERIIVSTRRRREKIYRIDQVDRVRVARLLIEEMGVNLEGTEVALNMREQLIAMQRQLNQALTLLGRGIDRER